MKTSLRKLRGFALHRHESKGRRSLRPLLQLDDFAQDMQDMRNCYDSLFSTAASTANSAYEFSESLGEMGARLLEKTALNDDEESGKVLLMLGKVQFELKKLVDSYCSHISQTITIPSESLLNELQIVEEMKRQCDEKRNVFESMTTRQVEKGRSRTGKGKSFSMQELQAAHDEYDKEATLFVFRLKSLKQGQSRSLLTQASRHHAAQLCFFRKALKYLERIEPHVKLVTKQQHIDYHFSGLEDDDGDYGDDVDDVYDEHDDGELSFDYGQNDQEQDVFSTAQNSMELDQVDITSPQFATLEAGKEDSNKSHWGAFALRREIRTGTHSAPLFAEKKYDPAEREIQMRQSSSWKFKTYVLPTPVDTKSSISTGLGNPVIRTRQTSLSGHTNNLWHSSPLEPNKYKRVMGGEKLSGAAAKNAGSVLKQRKDNTASNRLPPLLAEGLFLSQLDQRASDSKRFKRQAYSGPLTSKPDYTKSVAVDHPKLFSGFLLQKPISQPLLSSPKISASASPTFRSSPRISELHELPRPPISLIPKSVRSLSSVGHSAPLMSKGQELSGTNKSVVSSGASPLPTPSSNAPRSFSIHSSSPSMTESNASKRMEAPLNSEMTEYVASPPLTPISLANIPLSSPG